MSAKVSFRPLFKAENLLTVLAANLGLWDDQLARVGVISSLDWVVQDTDRLQDVASNLDLSWEVRWVTKNLLRLRSESEALSLLATLLHGGLDVSCLSGSIVGDLIKVGVQHVSSTVNSGETSEALWELSETVQWVDVWRLSVAGDRVPVETDALDGLWCSALLGDIVVSGVKRHGVADEIAGGSLKAELVEDILHGASLDVKSLVAGRVALVEGADPLNEGLHSALFEESHKGGCESLAGIGWDLGDGGLASGTLLDIRASNLLELEVSCDVGGNEDVGQLSGGHEKLGDQVNVPVVGAPVLLPWLLALVVVSVLLEELQVVRYCSLDMSRNDLQSRC